MELTTEQILNYIAFLEAKHRDNYAKLKTAGKTYRSRAVTQEISYLNALTDIKDAIEQPAKNEALSQAIKVFGEALKG